MLAELDTGDRFGFVRGDLRNAAFIKRPFDESSFGEAMNLTI